MPREIKSKFKTIFSSSLMLAFCGYNSTLDLCTCNRSIDSGNTVNIRFDVVPRKTLAESISEFTGL